MTANIQNLSQKNSRSKRRCTKYTEHFSKVKIGRKRFKYGHIRKFAYNADLKPLAGLAGIYALLTFIENVNKATDHIYVGRSFSLRDRLADYCQYSHVFRRKSKLYKHIQKYTPANLTFVILEYTTSKDKQVVLAREQFWINILKPKLNTTIKVHPATFEPYDNTLVI